MGFNFNCAACKKSCNSEADGWQLILLPLIGNPQYCDACWIAPVVAGPERYYKFRSEADRLMRAVRGKAVLRNIVVDSPAAAC